MATLLATGVASWYLASKIYAPLKWDWAALEAQGLLQPSKLTFSQGFLWGVGTSAQQVEGGCTNNSWSQWEQERDAQGKLLHVEKVAGNTCNQWDEKQMEHDIKLMQELGVNAYRFSVEWSKIEPQQGIIDQAAVDHYVTMCKKLRAAGIRPVITLHHYTDPLWFMAQGGFEKEENIKYYTNFCVTIFNALNKEYKPLWLTFNSPASDAINSYYLGTRPPGKKSMQIAVEVLSNLLQTHVEAYHAMKAQPDGKNSEIGILHNILHLDIWHYWNPLDYLARYLGNKLSHTCVYDFFTTGTFSMYIPGKASYTAPYNPHASSSLDFIGLNYYSHNYMRFFKNTPAPDEIPTANPQYTIYAEGLYRAIAELSDRVTEPLKEQLHKEIPIYVTENGIGTESDEIRETFFKRTLYALSQAHQKYNVKGYIHWSFMDNYEWGTYSKKYGVYAVNFATQERTFKKGAQHFRDVLARARWSKPQSLHAY
jgi:beta-glucosidase